MVKKSLKYILIYLLTAIVAAVGIVYYDTVVIGSHASGDEIGDQKIVLHNISEIPNDETASNLVMEAVMNQAMSLEFMNLDLAASINVSGMTIDVEGVFDLNLEIGSGDISLSGDATIDLDGESIPVRIIFNGKQIVLYAYGEGFYSSVEDVKGLINAILNLLGKAPLESGDSTFDASSLLSSMQKLTVEKDDTNAFVNIPLGEIGDVCVLLDYDLNIVGATSSNLSFGGANISLDAKITQYQEKREIIVPDTNALCNLGQLTDLITSVKPILDDKGVDANVALSFGQSRLSLNANVDFNNSLKANVKLLNSTEILRLNYANDVVLVDYNSIRLKAELNKLSLSEIMKKPIFTLLKDNFGIDLNSQINSIPNVSISVKDIVGILSSIRKYGNVYSLKAFGGLADVTVSNSQITNARAYFGKVSAEMRFNPFKPTTMAFSDAARVNVSDIVPLLDVAYETIKSGKINGEITSNVQLLGENIGGSLKAEIFNGAKLQLTSSLSGIDVDAKLINNEVFLDIENKLFNFNLTDTDKIISLLNDNGITFGSSDIIETLKKVNRVSFEEGKFILGFGKIKATVFYDTVITKVVVAIDDKTITATIGGESSCDQVALGERTNLVDVLPLVTSTINTIKDKSLSLSSSVALELNGEDLSLPINVAVDFNEQLLLNADVTYKDLIAKVTMQDESVFFDASNLKFVFPLSDIDSLKTYLKDTFDVDLTGDVDFAKIINDISLTFEENKLTVTYNDITVVLQFNEKFESLLANIKEVEISATFDEQTKQCQKLESVENYTSYTEITKIVTAVKNSVKNKSLSGTLNFDLQGDLEVNFDIDYVLDFSNGFLAEIDSDFYGLNLKGFYQEKSVLLNLQGLAIKLGFDEVDDLVSWINDKFETEIDLSKGINVKEILDNLYITFDENGAKITYNDITILVDYSDTLDSIGVTYNDITLLGNIDNEIKRLYREPTAIYNSYSYVTNLVDSVMSLLDERKFELDANAKVYYGLSELVNERFNADVDLSLDLSKVDFKNFDSSTLDIYGHAIVTGESNHDFKLHVKDNYIYADYLGLKLSMNIDNLAEVAVIALKALGVDTSKIPLLDEVAEGVEITADNLNNFIPAIDIDNPLNMLAYILDIRLYQDRIEFTFDDDKITSGAKEEMKGAIYFADNKVNKINLQNIYTGVTEGENFDLSLNLVEYSGEKPVQNPESYIDISDISDLLKGFVNTSELNDYALSATAKVRAEIIGIPITMDVPINAKVKIYEDKSVAIEVKMGEIPVIVGVNNDVPYVVGDTNGGNSRFLYIYFYDGEFYLYRSENVSVGFFGSRFYQKMTKVSMKGLLDDILYYLCDYGIGLSDSIMGAINDSANSERANPIDYSNIVKGYSLDKTNNVHKIKINIAEIAGDEKLGVMELNLYTGEQNGKKYLTKATFNLNMPLASAVNISIFTNDLTLDNIGSEVDLTSARDFMNNYPYKQEEEWESAKGNKNWTRTKYKEYSLSFVTNCDINQPTITNAAGEIISIPSYEDRIIDEDGYQNTYKFDGWFEKANFDEDSKFESNEMPRAEEGTNTTLYAKWTRIKHLKYVNFNIYGSVGIEDSTETVKETDTLIELPYNIENVVIDEDGYKNTYAFIGWYFSPTFTNGTEYTRNTVGTEDINVYAYFSLIDSLKYSNFVVEKNNGEEVSISTILENDELPTLESLENYVDDDGIRKIQYTFVGWYVTPDFAENTEYIGGVVGKEDLYLYAKWEENTTYYRTVSFDCVKIDNIESVTTLEGSVIQLPTFDNYVETIGNTTTTYQHKGFTLNDEQVESNFVVSNEDVQLVAVWEVISVEETRSLFIYYNDTLLSETRQVVGTAIAMPTNDLIRSDTKYYFDNNYQNETTIGEMGDSDLTIYVRNKYTLSFVSQYDSENCNSVTAYEKEQVTLPTLYQATFDDGNTERRVYTFNGWSDKEDRSNLVSYSEMPNFDSALYSKFTVDVTPYYTVSINYNTTFKYLLVTQTPKNITKSNQSFKVLKGTAIYISNYAASGKFKYGINYNCKTTGFKVNGTTYNNGSSFVVNGNVTLDAVWRKS